MTWSLKIFFTILNKKRFLCLGIVNTSSKIQRTVVAKKVNELYHYRRLSYNIYTIHSWVNFFDLAIFLGFQFHLIFIPNGTLLVSFGGIISDEFDRAMVRNLARCIPAQIPVAKQNYSDMQPKAAENYWSGIYCAQIRPKRIWHRSPIYSLVYWDIRPDFWLAN